MFPTLRVRPLAFALAGASLLALAACSSDDDAGTGSPFAQALSRDYTDLASQTDAAPRPDNGESFFDNPFGLMDLFGGGTPDPIDELVTAYNGKADLARQGQEPAPEDAPGDPTAQQLRARLVRALAAGKDAFAEQAARAQADYDCWVMDGKVPSMAAAAQACKTAFDGSLVALESSARPAPAPVMAPPPAPVAPPPPPAAAPSDYTVYFDFDSWTLTAEDLTVITNVINTARAGGQSHITIVGHTDTAGPAPYNQRLSVHRANVVVEALVDMGARRAAINASGVGENDLAVQTPDNTKEARNRRAVVTLQP